jgi:dipeptidyl aminopeptidase/acylaminoacyl peptidase
MDHVASISRIAWSPDGRHIAFGGHEEAGDPMENLWLVEVDGDGPPRRLVSHDFELDPASGVVWHPDGDRLAVTCLHRGVSRLAFVSLPDGQVHTIDRGLHGVTECGAWADRIAFVSVSMRRHEELHSVDWNGGDERRHTSLNRWFRKRERPKVSLRSFEVPDGEGGSDTIRAWVLLPRRGTTPYPLLVDMHGGPHSNVRINYAAHTCWYALLSEGWAIVAPDAVGSTGYGRDFARRLRGRWGALDLPQYEAVVRALADEGLVDRERVACAGKSYGGFLSAWAIGHGDLFRAAVISAPVSNVVSHFGTSDSGYYVTPWLVGREFAEDRDRWREQNTIDHLHKATAPTLILQGEDDARCPRGQAEEVFAHLVRETDVPVELVLYPGGTHGQAERGRPSHRLDYHQRICDWMLHWLGAKDEVGEARERRRA